MSEWKIIPGYENYAVNNKGEVKSLRFNRILKPSNSDSGYLYINLIKDKIIKSTAVHKLVMENFGSIKPSENYIIDHIDENKNNNNLDNLQWVTIRYNTEKYYNNFDKKSKILELHSQGYTTKQIKEVVNMSAYTIRQTILRTENN